MNLGSLAGGFTQGIPEGLQLQQTQQQNQGLADFGNALATAYGAQAAPSGAGPLGNIMSMFQGGGQQAPSPQQQPSIAPPIPRAAPSPAAGVASGPGQGGGGPMVAPQPQPPAQPPPQPPAQPPPQPPAQPQQPQGGQMPPQMLGQLDLPTLVRNLVKNGVQGARLGEAVQRFVPLLNAQGLQQYRGMMLNPNIPGTPAWGRVEGADPNNPGSAAYGRVQAAEDRKKNEADRMDRFHQSLAALTQRHNDTIQMETEKIRAGDNRAAAAESSRNVRAAIAEKYKITSREIAAANALDPDEKVKLQQQNAQDRDSATKELDDALKAQREVPRTGGDTGGFQQPPRQDQGDTGYTADGKQIRWTGRGDRKDIKNWVPVVGQQ